MFLKRSGGEELTDIKKKVLQRNLETICVHTGLLKKGHKEK